MLTRIIQHDRPGLAGEPVRVPEGYTRLTDYEDGRCLCEWFDERANKTDEYWIYVRSLT